MLRRASKRCSPIEGTIMFEKMGKKKYAVPLGALCGFLLLMSLLMYPMLRSEPANVPFAILSLDQGAETAAGTVNAGDALVDKVSGAAESQDGEDGAAESPIAWTVFTSQSDFDEAMENSEFYGGVVIPDDFTQTQVAAQAATSQVAAATAQAQAAAASGDAQAAAAAQAQLTQAQEAAQAKPTVQLVTDSAKNASLTQSLQTSLTSMLKDAGIAVETSTVHDADLGNSSASAMLGQLSVAPLLAMSMTGSMIMFLVTRAKAGASRKERAKTFGIQLAYAVGLSLCVAAADMFIACVVGGLDLPLATLLPYQWLCSFSIMALLLGIMNVAFPLGALGMMACMGTMSCAYIAPEMLPAAWLDWVYPWSPAHFVVEGVRQVVFLGAGVVNSDSLSMLAIAATGLVCGLVGALMANGKLASENQPATATAAA